AWSVRASPCATWRSRRRPIGKGCSSAFPRSGRSPRRRPGPTELFPIGWRRSTCWCEDGPTWPRGLSPDCWRRRSRGRVGWPAAAGVGSTDLAGQALDRWESLALATRRELLSALAGSPALAGPLIAALERETVAPRELDAATREGLRHLADAALRSRAVAVLA